MSAKKDAKQEKIRQLRVRLIRSEKSLERLKKRYTLLFEMNRDLLQTLDRINNNLNS